MQRHEMVPEADCQKIRNWLKGEKKHQVWFKFKKVKNAINIAAYVSEQKPSTALKPADFNLSHWGTTWDNSGVNSCSV